MIFNTHTLPEPIAPYIESVFHFKNFIPNHSIERVVPTGHVFLIFELDDIPRHTYDNATMEPDRTFTKGWISGMHRNHISISAHENSEMFVIQFKAFGAHPFLHLPVADLNDRILPAEEVLGASALDLRTALLEGGDPAGKFAIAEQWLQDRFRPDWTPPTNLRAIVSELQTAAAARYSDVIADYPNSGKHLIDQFKKYVGLTPKYYHRIQRFNEILQQIHQKQAITWPQVAYASGFADQSHFIKEFRHFSGFNPQEFIQQDYHKSAPNFFPLDRKG